MTPDEKEAIRARHYPYALASLASLFCEGCGERWPCNAVGLLTALDEAEAECAQSKAEVDRLTDNPEWDATEGAHPAWWRGCDHGVARDRARILAAVEGLPEPERTITWGTWEQNGWDAAIAAVIAIVKGEAQS
jgi:hypothetical protein